MGMHGSRFGSINVGNLVSEELNLVPDLVAKFMAKIFSLGKFLGPLNYFGNLSKNNFSANYRP